MLEVEAGLEVHRLAPVDGQLGGADRERAGGEDLARKRGGAVERALAFVGDAVDQTWGERASVAARRRTKWSRSPICWAC